MSFGEKLAKLRKEKGMSQEDLANNLNVSRQAVSKWESNSSYPETDKIIAICKLFNCSMDELIGLKERKSKESSKLINIFNKYFDEFIKGIKLFYAMTFKQKIKCLFEMSFYFIGLFIIFVVGRAILIEIIRKLLYLLPSELLLILIQIFDGLFYILYIVLMIYILVKLYKVRYLDYYENYLNNEIKTVEKDTEEKNEELKSIKIKEEKIIIRDANNEFKPFSLIKKIWITFCKIIALFISIGLGVSFILLIACTIFVLYFIKYGILIVYIVCGLIGSLLAIYVFIELFIKFIFSMKQSPKRLFIMFIISMLSMGISSGLFACELVTYNIMTEPNYDTIIHEETIEMEDNLIIGFLEHYNVEIVHEDRDDILIEFYGTELNKRSIDIYKDEINCKNNAYSETKHFVNYYYNFNDYFNGTSINSFLKTMLQSIKDKKIISEEYYFEIKPKIYISEKNYYKLKSNEISEYQCSYYVSEYDE